MPEIWANGVRLHYEETGVGRPERVVFSHGYLMSSHQFHYQMTALRSHYHCLAYDHRGHGQSEVPAMGYEMENLYADAVAFLEEKKCTPCHFVGLSTGGFIGLRLAIRRPELLKSLILLDTSAEPEAAEGLKQYRLMAQAVRFLGWRPVISQVMPKLFGAKFLQDKGRKAEVAEWRRRVMAVNRQGAFGFGMGIWGRESVLAQLGQIQTPTLMIVDEVDVATPLAYAERIVAGIPGARLAVIPEAGHSSPIEEPGRVTAVIQEFLQASHTRS